MPKIDIFKRLTLPMDRPRPWVLLGHGYFLAMLVLSVVFYQERMLAMDTAYYTFQVITQQDFFTGHERTISYLPQLLPILVMKLGGSLKAALIAYSMGFVLFYYAAFNLIVYLFRNPQAGIFLALALGLTMRYKFYGPVGEVVLSIVYLGLLIGWLTKPPDRFERLPTWLDVLIGGLIATLLITAHPFIIVSTAVVLGFVLIFQKEWLNPRFWLISLYTIALLLYRFYYSAKDDYETERADRLKEAWNVLENYQDYYISQLISEYFVYEYALPCVFFLLSLLLLIAAKKYFTSLYLLVSFLVVLGIVIVTHAYLTSSIYIMVDGYLVHLGLIWALPLAFFFGRKQQTWMFLSIGILLTFSLVRITENSRFFRERLAYVRGALDEHTSTDQPKGVAYMKEYMNYEALWIGWALGVETLLLSSLDGPEHSRTIYHADRPKDMDGRLDQPKLFLSVTFGPKNVRSKDLPQQYFQLPNVPYREVNLE